MDIKKYMIDETPVTVDELIQAARDIDKKFDESHFWETSEAAWILREHGHTVSRNTNN